MASDPTSLIRAVDAALATSDGAAVPVSRYLLRRLRDALVGTPTFRCDTHRCGECAGCRARGIDDDLRRAWAERDEARAALAEANATIKRVEALAERMERSSGDGGALSPANLIRRAIEGPAT